MEVQELGRPDGGVVSRARTCSFRPSDPSASHPCSCVRSPQKNTLVDASTLDQPGVGKVYSYGWSAFPPKGLKGAGEEQLGVTGEDLHASQIRGPNNAQISSAKLYASNGN